jgi:hypothetical protein
VSFVFGFLTAVVVVPMARAFVEGWRSSRKPRPLKRLRRKVKPSPIEKRGTILVPRPPAIWFGQRPFDRQPD